MTKFIEVTEVLRKLCACDEALAWLEARSHFVEPELRTGAAAWADCPHGEWLVWLVTHVRIAPAVGDRALRLIACDCAEDTLEMYERFRHDGRPRHAIEVGRRYAEGRASDRELWDAYGSALQAVEDLGAGVDPAFHTDAAFARAAAVRASFAAEPSSRVAAYNAASNIRQSAQADAVRAHVSWPVVRDALARIAGGAS